MGKLFAKPAECNHVSSRNPRSVTYYFTLAWLLNYDVQVCSRFTKNCYFLGGLLGQSTASYRFIQHEAGGKASQARGCPDCQGALLRSSFCACISTSFSSQEDVKRSVITLTPIMVLTHSLEWWSVS